MPKSFCINHLNSVQRSVISWLSGFNFSFGYIIHLCFYEKPWFFNSLEPGIDQGRDCQLQVQPHDFQFSVQSVSSEWAFCDWFPVIPFFRLPRIALRNDKIRRHKSLYTNMPLIRLFIAELILANLICFWFTLLLFLFVQLQIQVFCPKLSD